MIIAKTIHTVKLCKKTGNPNVLISQFDYITRLEIENNDFESYFRIFNVLNYKKSRVE